MRSVILVPLFFLFVVFQLVNAQEGIVKTYTEILTIPTYPWTETVDINPQFRWTNKAHYSPNPSIYPYAMKDNLTQTIEDINYEAMVIENDYLKVTVIPEVGGHVHSVLDKTTGENMLYENNVIKPSLIGIAGAWASGGIEFNTGPNGHTVTAMSPVEASFVDYPDGSKAIAIGNVEQVFHTQWVAIVRLRPDRAYLEETIRIYNPTHHKHMYYFWNCVAFPDNDAIQYIYPISVFQDHWGRNFTSYPIDRNGTDRSWLKNAYDPSGFFAYKCNQDFFGAYDHENNRGVISFMNHYELEGKKTWTWGRSQWGNRAAASLTDDGSHYLEIQTGPFPTQSEYGALEPHQTIEWKEWWYPVHGTKGVYFSNKDVTANIIREKQMFSLLVTGTASREATCTIDGIGSMDVDITPGQSSRLDFKIGKTEEPYSITVTSGDDLLAEFTYPLNIAEHDPEPYTGGERYVETSAAGCWLKGLHRDKEGGTHEAFRLYNKAIEMDSLFSPAMTSLGELKLHAGEYEEAKELLENSIYLNINDGWAKYYLAQAYLELGYPDDALVMAYKAAQLQETVAQGYNLAGSIHIRLGEYDKAIYSLSRAVDMNGQDLNSRNLLACALWKNGDKEGASRQIEEVWKRDPLDIYSGIIADFMGKDDGGTYDRISGKKDEVLDAADFFLSAGLKDEALLIIDKYHYNAFLPEFSPLIHYYYGILGNDIKYLDLAFTMDPDYVWPTLRSSFGILEEVIRLNPEDWKARLYLGNMMFERCRKEDAVKMWNEALAINDSYSVLHRNLGLIEWRIENQPWKAIYHYKKALVCNPNDFTLYRDLGMLYVNETHQYIEAVQLLEKAREMGCVRGDIATLLGTAYNHLGKYKKTLDLLAANTYANFEGHLGINQVYTAARIGLGNNAFAAGNFEDALYHYKESMIIPLNLGPGQMHDLPHCESHYLKGLALEKLDRMEEAKKSWELAAKRANRGDERNRMFGAEAKSKLNLSQ